MRSNKLLIMCCFVLLMTAPMFADLVVGSGATDGFIAGVTPTAVGPSSGTLTNSNQSPSAYWDHSSQDATSSTAACNVGWIVTKTTTLAGCSAAGSNTGPLGAEDPVATSYWGQTVGTPGNYDPAFTFTNTSPNTAEFEVSLAGFGAGNVFGYFDAGGLHPLFNGGSAAETTTVNIPGGDSFGFSLTNGNGVTYKTNDGGVQHFALFATDNAGGNLANKTTNNFYIGAEDSGPSGLGTGSPGADFDYNDVVAHISAVPEPGSLPIMLSGFVGMALVLRRRLQAKK